jgi:hypothetical protein
MELEMEIEMDEYRTMGGRGKGRKEGRKTKKRKKAGRWCRFVCIELLSRENEGRIG